MNKRSYSRSEIAALYLPLLTQRSALRQFNHWLEVNTRLQQRLKELGVNERTRMYTPRQVEVIFDELGEPF